MPELPDIEVFSGNLKKLFAGKQLAKVKVIGGKNIKDKPKELSKSLEGSKLTDVYRSGKEMRLKFSNGSILGVHLMLTGDVFVFDKKNDKKSTIAELHFKDGSGLALVDRFKAAYIKLNPEEKAGIDALDPKLNYKKLKEILNRKAAIKNVLLDQSKIRGIGNAYSDEILWQTRISPFSVANAIPDEKIQELAKTIKTVLKGATKKIKKDYPDIIHGEIRDFLQIHTKKQTHSPSGKLIKLADRGMLKTYYTEEQKLYK